MLLPAGVDVRTVTIANPRLEPTTDDLDGFMRRLESSWTARVTVTRQSQGDIGLRQIYVLLDDERIAVLTAGQAVTREVMPGPHRLRVHNTLFWKRLDFTVAVGEHVTFSVVNRKGFGTYSLLAYFLGTNMIYLSLEREPGSGGGKYPADNPRPGH